MGGGLSLDEKDQEEVCNFCILIKRNIFMSLKYQIKDDES